MKLIKVGETGYLVSPTHISSITSIEECDKLLQAEPIKRTADNIVVSYDTYKELVDKKKQSIIEKKENQQRTINKLRVDLATKERELKDARELFDTKSIKALDVIKDLRIQIALRDEKDKQQVSEYENTIKELKEAHKNELLALSEEHKIALEIKNQELSAKNEEVDNEIQSLRSALVDEKERRFTIEKAFEAQIKTLTQIHEQRTTNLSNKVKVEKEKVHKLGSQIEKVAEQKEKLEEEVSAKQETIRALTEEIRTLRTAIKKNEVGLSQLSYVVTQARKHYDGFDEFIKAAADAFNKDLDDEEDITVEEDATVDSVTADEPIVSKEDSASKDADTDEE